MKCGFNGLVKIIIGLIFFLAALAEIASYLETSTWLPGVVAMLSAIASPETLTSVYRLLFLFATVVSLWWLSRQLQEARENWNKIWQRLQTLEDSREQYREQYNEMGQRLQKLEGVKEGCVALKANQVLYPPENEVLWEWDEKVGASGPFCPVHGIPLVYKDYMRKVQPDFTNENFLGSTGRFACLTDSKDFVFYEPPTLRVGELRSQAATVLRAQMNERRR